MRYAVVIERYEQCSPDDYDKMYYIKEINNKTTIKDLIERILGYTSRVF